MSNSECTLCSPAHRLTAYVASLLFKSIEKVQNPDKTLAQIGETDGMEGVEAEPQSSGSLIKIPRK